MHLLTGIVLMSHTVASLVFVVENSSSQVRSLSERLDSATPRQLESLLRSLAKEADVLSAGLTRLSQHVDEIPDDKAATSKEPPVVDRRLIEFSTMVRAAITDGFCPQCGGIANVEITSGDRQV